MASAISNVTFWRTRSTSQASSSRATATASVEISTPTCTATGCSTEFERSEPGVAPDFENAAVR